MNLFINKKILFNKSSNIPISASHLNSFDFSSIRDDFRQHIHSRRSNESSDLILLDDHLIQNLLKLKQETFSLLQKFRNVSIKQQSSKVKSFSSFKEFVSFVQNQEEILHSELWKLEAILNYIEALQLSESPPSRSPNLNSPKFHQ